MASQNQQNLGGNFLIAWLCRCRHPSAGLWTFWLFLILLPVSETKCYFFFFFLLRLFLPLPIQKNEQRFGVCTKCSIFTKKIFTTLRLFALVMDCQALLRAQCRANPPTHMHTHTYARTHTHTVFTCQFSSHRKFVFFILRGKLELDKKTKITHNSDAPS